MTQPPLPACSEAEHTLLAAWLKYPTCWAAEYDLMLFLITGAYLDFFDVNSLCTAEILMPPFPLSFMLFT